MATTLTRLFDSHTQALDAVSDLEAAGVDSDRISIISNNSDNWHAGHKHRDNDLSDDSRGEVAEGAGKGAATGGVLGAGAGVLAGLGMLAIPGLGPVVAAGWFAALLTGAAAGAVAGGVAGGIVDALADNGMDAETAQVYAEGIRRGGTLVTVRADDSEDVLVQRLLDQTPPVDMAARERLYREGGWRGFDPTAAAADEANRQRSA